MAAVWGGLAAAAAAAAAATAAAAAAAAGSYHRPHFLEHQKIAKYLYFAMKQRRNTKICYFYLLYLPSDVFKHDGRPPPRPAVAIDYSRW